MKKRKNILEIKNNMRGSYSIFKVKSLFHGDLPYGTITIPEGDVVFAPRNAPMNMVQSDTLYNIWMMYEKGHNLDNSSLLIVRYGGIGDLLSMVPGIIALRQRWKNVKIGVIASPSYSDVLQVFPNLIDEIYAPICSFKDIRKYKHMLIMDDALENDPESKTKSIQQIYAKHLGMNLNHSNIAEIIARNFAVQETHRKHGIGIQYHCDSSIRNYNIDKTIDLINILQKEYPKEDIYLLGKPNDTILTDYISSKVSKPVIINNRKLIDTMVLVNGLKLVIGPDSSMIHIAGFCNTPSIGLYGPFPSKLRMEYYLNGVGIDGKSECSPCFRHFPESFCKYNNGEGICLNSIEPELILEVSKELLKKKGLE